MNSRGGSFEADRVILSSQLRNSVTILKATEQISKQVNSILVKLLKKKKKKEFANWANCLDRAFA